jgi:hypothetical protein
MGDSSVLAYPFTPRPDSYLHRGHHRAGSRSDAVTSDSFEQGAREAKIEVQDSCTRRGLSPRLVMYG